MTDPTALAREIVGIKPRHGAGFSIAQVDALVAQIADALRTFGDARAVAMRDAAAEAVDQIAAAREDEATQLRSKLAIAVRRDQAHEAREIAAAIRALSPVPADPGFREGLGGPAADA